MSRKKRTYSLHLIRHDYSYTVEQVADLFSIDVATVRRWLSCEGLLRIPKTRPYLIHSSELSAYIQNKQMARKHSCREGQLYCMKCRSPQCPKLNSGRVTELPNGTYRFAAKCQTCNSSMNKVIGRTNWSNFHPLASYLYEAQTNTSESHHSPRECPLGEKGQLCLILTP